MADPVQVNHLFLHVFILLFSRSRFGMPTGHLTRASFCFGFFLVQCPMNGASSFSSSSSIEKKVAGALIKPSPALEQI